MKVILALSLLFIISVISAETIVIPEDQPTIQQGVDYAIDGDVILLNPGIYYENVDFCEKDITLTSLYYTTQDTSYISQTIIDGSSSNSVIKIENCDNALVSGLTIQNGYSSGVNVDGKGGGINCYQSTASLENLKIINNTAEIDGGGIYSGYSTVTIYRCYLNNNIAYDDGGGLCIVEYSIVNVVESGIRGSVCYDDGGGYTSSGYALTIFEDCIFYDNTANDNGGGLYLTLSNVELYRCLVINNTSFDGAGGIDVWTADAIIDKCNFFFNSSHQWSGGLSSFAGSTIDLKNSIVAMNTGFGIQGNSTVTFCDFWFNSEGNFDQCDPAIGNIVTVNNNGDPSDIFNNILMDPLCIAASAGNFNLQEDSPCIDAGDPESPLDPDSTITDIGVLSIDQVGLVFADFSGTPTSGLAPFTVLFTDLSTSNYSPIISWEWDFENDGIIDSYEQNPSNTYQIPGNYTVKLTVSSSTDISTEIKDSYINVDNPVTANFEANPQFGYLPLEVQFADLSVGNITFWEWDFNSDGIIDSYEQNPIYTYVVADSFSITLTVTDDVYSDTLTKQNYVSTREHVNCNFNGFPTSGLVPLEVQFNDLSSGSITSWQWDFNNDGIIDSTEPNTSCTYSNIGTYTVKCIVTDGIEEDNELKLDYISVTLTGTNDILSPTITELHHNSPNPFNPITYIYFDIKENESGELSIFNVKGQILMRKYYTSGTYCFPWDAADNCSGLFFYKLNTESYEKTRKMILMK
jgi:PKD repeat protein